VGSAGSGQQSFRALSTIASGTPFPEQDCERQAWPVLRRQPVGSLDAIEWFHSL
jgi:hypothetical protein